MIGGIDDDNKTLSDAWLLDVQSRRWREVRSLGATYRLDLKLEGEKPGLECAQTGAKYYFVHELRHIGISSAG